MVGPGTAKKHHHTKPHLLLHKQPLVKLKKNGVEYFNLVEIGVAGVEEVVVSALDRGGGYFQHQVGSSASGSSFILAASGISIRTR